jgi:hypothetical protein
MVQGKQVVGTRLLKTIANWQPPPDLQNEKWSFDNFSHIETIIVQNGHHGMASEDSLITVLES